MGNPLKKENLGNNMTGGHGALPYFNDFMNVFMKGKPIEKFPEPPPMPVDIKREAEIRKREDLEKARRRTSAGRKIGAMTPTKIDPTAPIPGEDKPLPGGTTEVPKPETEKPIRRKTARAVAHSSADRA